MQRLVTAKKTKIMALQAKAVKQMREDNRKAAETKLYSTMIANSTLN